jgi:uncharacterized membrane protein
MGAGGCSPARLATAMVVFLVMISIFFFGLIILIALVNSSSTSPYVDEVYWPMLGAWVVIGIPLMLYITYLIGFNCADSDGQSGKVQKKTV